MQVYIKETLSSRLDLNMRFDPSKEKNEQVEGDIKKINQVRANVWKSDQLQFMSLAVDQFFKLRSSFDRILKHACLFHQLEMSI